MNYKINYLKYKKNVDLKVQLGGMDKADINSEVVSILEKTLDTNNLGQNNCGIIPYLDYILKCSGGGDALVMNDSIREYFPQYYLWPNGEFINNINTKPFYIMEKLDGDLTKYIIEQSYIRAYGSLEEGSFTIYGFNAFKLYYETLPKTMNPGLFAQRAGKYSEYLSEKAIKILDEIKLKVKPHIIDILNNLQPKIIELHHNLIKKNYIYVDLKLDNIGYKILEDESIKLYFIDIESGLEEIDEGYKIYQEVKSLLPEHEKYKYVIITLSEDKKKATIRSTNSPSFSYQYEDVDVDILVDADDKFRNFLNSHGLTSYLQNYNIFGQYNLNGIYNLKPISEKFNLNYIESAIEKITIKYGTGTGTGTSIDRKYNILTKENGPRKYIKYRCSGNNDFFCIQICTVYLRLVRFDDYGRYQSNTIYNNDFTPIDELFDNLESLLSRLEEIYPN